MKSIIILLTTLFVSLAALAQTVTIKVNGNRNQQVILNGVAYNIDNNSSSSSKTITVQDLQPGQHSIKVVRTGLNNRSTDATTNFSLKEGYDVSIIVAGSGNVQVREIRSTGTAVSSNTAMTEGEFNLLLRNVRNHWRNSSRMTAATNAFTKRSYYFTSSQAARLIEVVSGDENRLSLAKLAYSRITDPNNFVAVYNLIGNQANKDVLTAYIRSQTGADVVYSWSETYRPAMSNTSFNNLVEQIENQWQANSRLNTITTVFANEANNFTTYQIGELIKLIDHESSRLHLLKAAYSRVVDPANFPQLYTLLSSASAKTELVNYVNAAEMKSGLVNYNLNRVPMTDASFNALYNQSRNHFRSSSKLEDVRTAFADITHYFTSSQAAQLISLVEGEAQRLSVAKAAYRSITDPENYLIQMDNLLMNPDSKTELKEYVFEYRGK